VSTLAKENIMPLHDGTGPLGLGPRTGRGKGRCCTGFEYKSVSYSALGRRNGWLLGIVLPLGTAILRDLLNPSGVIRRILHASSTPKISEDVQKTRREAEFTVMDTHTFL